MYNPNYTYYYDVARYAENAYIEDSYTIDDLKSQGMMCGGLMLAPSAYRLSKGLVWDTPKWTIQNFGNYTSAFEQIQRNNAAAKQSVAHLKGNNIFQTINNRSYYDKLINFENSIPKAPELNTSATNAIKVANEQKTARYYSKAKRLIEEAKTKKLTGKALKAQLQQVEKEIAKGDLKVYEAVQRGYIKPATKIGKVGAYVKKCSGLNAVDGALIKGAASSNTAVKALSKGAKGGGIAMAAIAMAVETPEIIETYKTLGTGKGTKQLAKTSAVVAAETAGYIVGAKVGGIAGAKVGAVIGTAIGGPIGTGVGAVVGGIIGVGTGILCSWLAGKGMKKLVGKTELEKDKEEKAKNLAKNAMKSEEGKQELLESAQKRAEEEGGCTDEKVLEAYEKLVNDKENIVTQNTADSGGKEKTTTISQTASSQTPTTVETTTSEYTGILASLSSFINNCNNSSNGYTGSYSNMYNSFNYSGMYNNPFLYNLSMYYNPYQTGLNLTA